VTSAEAGFALLRLDQPTRLFDGFEAKIEGNGRIVGYVMIKQDRTPMASRPSVYAFRYRRCNAIACEGPSREGTTWGHDLEGPVSDPVIPAGMYRVYVLTDGAPARVIFTIDTASGRAAVQTTHTTELQIGKIDMRVSENNTGAIYSAGEGRPFKGQGIAIMSTWLEGDSIATGAQGDCMYFESPPPPEIAYAPGCPLGNSRPTAIVPSPDGFTGENASTMGFLPHALGAYHVISGEVSDYGAIAAWLKY
jgi:hypothetical protein